MHISVITIIKYGIDNLKMLALHVYEGTFSETRGTTSNRIEKVIFSNQKLSSPLYRNINW